MVFYEYVKGVSSTTSSTITKINFTDAFPQCTVNSSSVGEFVCAKGTMQKIYKTLTFMDGETLNCAINANSLTANHSYEIYTTGSLIYNDFNLSVSRSNLLLGNGCTITPSGNLTVSSIDAIGSITATGSITGSYFNATSDKKAKTKINLINQSAIDYINQIPVYEYVYKSDKTQEPVIGVMAQDFEEIGTFNNMDFVVLPQKDQKYKSIKESKLIYILWKAVQELDSKNKELENKIIQLEKPWYKKIFKKKPRN